MEVKTGFPEDSPSPCPLSYYRENAMWSRQGKVVGVHVQGSKRTGDSAGGDLSCSLGHREGQLDGARGLGLALAAGV